ncbi:MAG: hypothetical protein R3B93_20560 [Bacteroidia bacterium]
MNQIALILQTLSLTIRKVFNLETYLNQMDVNEKLQPLPKPVSDQEKYFISAKNLYNLYYNIQSQEKRMEKYTIQAPFNGALACQYYWNGSKSGTKTWGFYRSMVL